MFHKMGISCYLFPQQHVNMQTQAKENDIIAKYMDITYVPLLVYKRHNLNCITACLAGSNKLFSYFE